MNPNLRVAFLTDSFHEVNGVALTSRQLAAYAQRNNLPFLSIVAGPKESYTRDGNSARLELPRSRASIGLDHDLFFDPFFWRHTETIARAIKDFRAQVIHVTGPGDLGTMGALMAWRFHMPMVSSWHTSLHEFGSVRLKRVLPLPKWHREATGAWAEEQMRKFLVVFYQLARVVLAPNPELVAWLGAATERPALLMSRGVDIGLFSPEKRRQNSGVPCLGYCGRLSKEKNVRFLVQVERFLLARGIQDFRFLIVGDGSERPWLEQNLGHAEFTGVLRGEALARAYASMDLFVFPSETDTFGNVVLEALASGTPCLVTAKGGPRFLVRHGETGYVAADDAEFLNSAQDFLTRRPAMREACRESALEFSWDRAMEVVWTAYERAVTSSSTALGTTSWVGRRSGPARPATPHPCR